MRLEDDLPRDPVLRFTPTAWAKLQCFCHAGDTEIGGFGITSPEDLLLVVDFITVKQRVSSVTVAFDDLAVADFFDSQVDQGRKPEQFGRIWLHTHPGNCPEPSCTDEETFRRVFGSCDWAIMAILARGGQTYARLRFNIGPGGQVLIPVEVDYQVPFAGSDHESWMAEYVQNIHPEPRYETWEESSRGQRKRDKSKRQHDHEAKESLAEREERDELEELVEWEELHALELRAESGALDEFYI